MASISVGTANRRHVAAVVTEQRVMCACSVCGLRFDASVRSARDYRSGRAEPRCMLHRKHKPGSSRSDIAALRRWWLDRFTVDEIVEMGSAIWGRPSQRLAGLTASSEPRDHRG